VKILKATLMAMALFAFSPLASAQTYVDIVVMAETDADISVIPEQLLGITSAMTASGVSVNVNFAYGGVPQVVLPMSGFDTTQHGIAINSSLVQNARDGAAADLALIFVDDLSGCGFAPANQWNGSGINGTAPDLSGVDTSFVALVSTGSTTNIFNQPLDCQDLPFISAHEIGHLFGGGHELATNQGPYLWDDSAADYTKPPLFPGQPDGYYTVMISTIPALCIGIAQCDELNKYSDLTTATDGVSNQTNNRKAVLDTKSSVAAYRNPGCQLIKPDPVFGAINNPCDPDPWTSHNMAWYDSCEDESEFYEIYAQQPAIWGGLDINYVHVWNVSVPWDEVFVRGDAANFRVKSCNSTGCSGKSDTWYWADAICEGH